MVRPPRSKPGARLSWRLFTLHSPALSIRRCAWKAGGVEIARPADKLHVDDRAQAVVASLRDNILPPRPDGLSVLQCFGKGAAAQLADRREGYAQIFSSVGAMSALLTGAVSLKPVLNAGPIAAMKFPVSARLKLP